jgi:hypothetical protein
MTVMRSAISYLKFWEKGTDMPGVADAERRTKSAQEQKGRKLDRENLMQLLAEGRLHEADAHQVEQIKLALELSEMLGVKQESAPGLDEEKLAAALRVAVADVVAAIPTGFSGGSAGSSSADTSRPGMKHTSLTSITHKESGLDVVGGDKLATESEGEEGAAEKLARLRELKGNK